MQLRQQMAVFFEANTGTYYSTDDRSMLLAFANFIQARLNTNLAYIGNAPLMEALGLSREEVLEEIRILSEIASKINIPDKITQDKTFGNH